MPISVLRIKKKKSSQMEFNSKIST